MIYVGLNVELIDDERGAGLLTYPLVPLTRLAAMLWSALSWFRSLQTKGATLLAVLQVWLVAAYWPLQSAFGRQKRAPGRLAVFLVVTIIGFKSILYGAGLSI